MTSESYSLRTVPSRVPVFFFHEPAPSDIYTLSLHDALPISAMVIASASFHRHHAPQSQEDQMHGGDGLAGDRLDRRSEEHTSELQSHSELVCRLLLEKKKEAAPGTDAAAAPLAAWEADRG